MGNENRPYDELRISHKVRKDLGKNVCKMGCVVFLVLLCGTTWPIVKYIPGDLAKPVLAAYIVATSIPISIYVFLRIKSELRLLSDLRKYGIEICPELIRCNVYIPYRGGSTQKIISVTYKFEPPKSKSKHFIEDTFDIICRASEVNAYQKFINDNKMVIVFLRYNQYGLGIRY